MLKLSKFYDSRQMHFLFGYENVVVLKTFCFIEIFKDKIAINEK